MFPPGFSVDAPVQKSKQPVVVTMTTSADPTTDSTSTPEIVQDDDAVMRKKLLAGSTSASIMRMPQVSNTQQTQYAAFRGLFVVQSATEARHVRYAMDINCPELQLHLRVTERYNSFYLLRKRLLKSLKRCHVDGARPTLNESPFGSLDFHKTLRHPCCAGCAQIRKTLKRVPFPKRSLVFTTTDDVDARPPQLEAFLDTCFRLLADWQGCVRGRKFACVVLGKFLSLNLLFHVFQQLRLTMLAEQAEQATAASQLEDQDKKPEPHQPVASDEDAAKKPHDQEPQATPTNQVDAV